MNSIDASRRVLDYGISALHNLKPLIDSPEFSEAIEVLSSGRIWTIGMGKAALSSRKLSTTLACNGIAAAFMHPGEALHGDFGSIQKGDKVVAFSNSGKTLEVVQIAEKAAVIGDKVILVTGEKNSPLAKISGITLCYGNIKEACPLGLTPTSSILTMMAISDALAMGVQAKIGLTYEQYALHHHAGYLGQIARHKSETNIK